MKQGNKIIVATALVFFFVQGSVFAKPGKTNNIPRVETVSTNVVVIARGMADAEKLWKEKPEAYFRAMRKNAKHLWQVEITSDEEYQVLFSSFTNMIRKPISADEKRSSEMLSLQSNSVKDYMRNDRVRNDRDAWIATAKYIGAIRSRIPSHISSSCSSTNIVMPPSMEEWRRGRAKASYNLTLKHENKSLTSSLLIYMENLSNRGLRDEEYFQQLADLANLTEEERKKLGKR